MKKVFVVIKKNPQWVALIGLIGVIGTFIFGIISLLEKPAISIIVGIALSLLALLIIVYAKWKSEIIKHKKPKISDYKRFEEVVTDKTITYGFIDYRPFFRLKDGNKDGIGWSIINKIFDNNIFIDCEINQVDYNEEVGHNWESIFKDLERKKYNVIITPMYETKSRLYDYNIAFCLPLFYSDIGIYVRENDLGKFNNDIQLSFDDATFKLTELFSDDELNWKPELLKGEISEIMFTKHINKNNNNTKTSNKNGKRTCTDDDFINKLGRISDKGELKILLAEESDRKEESKKVKILKEFGDFIFMEVFKAEKILNSKDFKRKHKFKLVNVLKKNNLVYPVSFVVRKEETVLRNFINLRIAELKRSGELYNIINKESKSYGIEINQVEDRFIQTYDFSLIDKKYKTNPIHFSHKIKNEYDILDTVYDNNFVTFQKKIKDELEKTKNGKELNILEIGCGTGITSKIILDSNLDLNLFALDSDPEMIEKTKKNLKNHSKYYKLHPIKSDSLTYLTNNKNVKYDVIVSAFTIHNFDKDYREDLLKAIKNSMETGSLFINVDKYAPDDDKTRSKALAYRIEKYTNVLQKDNPELLKEWVNHYIEDQSENKVMKAEETKKLMEKLGFEIVDYKESGELEMMAILTAKKT